MAKEKLTYEQALEKLEAIVSAIEAGEVPLEESIDKYAEGIKLLKQCRTILDKAEEKIQLLARGQDDELTEAGELQTDEAPEAPEATGAGQEADEEA